MAKRFKVLVFMVWVGIAATYRKGMLFLVAQMLVAACLDAFKEVVIRAFVDMGAIQMPQPMALKLFFENGTNWKP